MKHGTNVKGRGEKILSAGGRFFPLCLYTLDSREVRNFLCFLIKNKNTLFHCITAVYTLLLMNVKRAEKISLFLRSARVLICFFSFPFCLLYRIGFQWFGVCSHITIYSINTPMCVYNHILLYAYQMFFEVAYYSIYQSITSVFQNLNTSFTILTTSFTILFSPLTTSFTILFLSNYEKHLRNS